VSSWPWFFTIASASTSALVGLASAGDTYRTFTLALPARVGVHLYVNRLADADGRHGTAAVIVSFAARERIYARDCDLHVPWSL